MPSDEFADLFKASGKYVFRSFEGYEKIKKLSSIASKKKFFKESLECLECGVRGKTNTSQVIIEEATAAGWAV
jgi:hypothetical protein